MVADPNDFSILQYDDLFGVHDSADPLRNDQYRRVFCFLSQCFTEGGLGLKIERGKAVIKKIQIGLFHQRPCYG